MRKRPSKFQLIWKVFTIKKDSGMICGVLFFKMQVVRALRPQFIAIYLSIS